MKKKYLIVSSVITHYISLNLILTFLFFQNLKLLYPFAHFPPFGIIPIDLAFFIVLYIYIPLLYFVVLTSIKIMLEVRNDKKTL